MNKKRILLSVTITSMLAAGAVLAINGGLKGSSVFATNGEVWYHFAAVAPTKDTHGSKEFWASSADGCATHTFTDPKATCVERDFSKNDSFVTLTCDDDRYVPSGNESLGITPMFSTKNNTVTYGLYPQTVVDDENLITKLNALSTIEDNGYYFYENAYYVEENATLCESGYKFDNGTAIVDGTAYWFKCEPITWNVLSNTAGEYCILSGVLLDASCYYQDTSNRTVGDKTIYPNNYEGSYIRFWLNNNFYNTAFALDSSYIQETTVDNSVSTTSPSDNPYVCNDTQDKVFLPSYQDFINPAYGFLNSEDETNTRYCKTTDWARARGVYMYTFDDSYEYNGYYWTRSPGGSYSECVWYAHSDGALYDDGYVNEKDGGVRPSLTIKIA